MNYKEYPFLKISAIQKFMQENNSAPLKKWGQNFLIDPNIIEYISHIVSTAVESKEISLVEIGSGLGALTYPLSLLKKDFYILEIDPIYVSHLKENVADHNPHVHILSGDALNTISNFKGTPSYLVGNLPYYITSELIVTVLKTVSQIQGGIFMVQKEFGDRLCNEISSLSVFASFFGKFQLSKVVSKNCFYPAPKAESCLIQFKPHANRLVEKSKDIFILELVLRSIFWGKRKTLNRSIQDSPFFKESAITEEYPEIQKKILNAMLNANIPTTKRPEELNIEDYHRLMKEIQEVT